MSSPICLADGVWAISSGASAAVMLQEHLRKARDPCEKHKERREKMAGQLDELFQLQGELNRKIGIDTLGVPEAKKPEWILNYCRALSQEIAELTDSVPWKWWAKYQSFDKQNARVEVVDMFHFLISLAQVLDMSAEDVCEAYRRMHMLNVERQNSGYTVKNESDSRHI